MSARLTTYELLGFVAIIGAFIATMVLFDVEPSSWASFGLLAGFLVLLYGYRFVLRRRRADG